MPESNEAVWRVVFAVLGSIVTGLLVLMRSIIRRTNGNGRPSDREFQATMRRDLDSLQRSLKDLSREVDRLVRQEEIRREIEEQSHR